MTMQSVASEAVPSFATSVPRSALAHIPGEEGWPLVGRTLHLLADPQGEVERMAAKYGPVYRSRAFGETSVTMLGPEANELVLFDQTKLFSSTHGWESILGRLFPRGLMLMDFEEHRGHRRALSVAFKAGPMRSYLAQLDLGIAKRVALWRSKGEMLVYPAMKQLTLDLAATSFLGADIGPEVEVVTTSFIDMVAAAVAPIRVPIPGTQMARGVNGRKRIVEYFSKQIPLRRGNQGGDDLFSQLCRATDDDGALLSTQDVVDHMSFLMMAAHDTLTSSLTSFINFLAADRDWQNRLRDEVLALGLRPDEPLPFDKLDALPLVEMAFKESMRLRPPVPSIPRRATRDFTFGGYKIPGGTWIGINPLYTHMMPTVWPDPTRFDPLRFTDEAQRNRHKYAFVPFGGGAHMCLGLHFAYMQAKCFARHVLQNLDLSLAPGYTSPWAMWPIPKPKDGLRVTVRPAA